MTAHDARIAPNDLPADTSRIVSGRWILLSLLVIAMLIPFLTWIVLRNVEAKMALDDAPLVWSERATWTSPPIKRTTLEKVQSSPMEGGRPVTTKWVRLDFAISPEVEAVLRDAAAIASRDDFASDATGPALEALATRTVTLLQRNEGEREEQRHRFYLNYLLGAWHAARGEEPAADEAFARAFADAPAVVKVRYLDMSEHPQASLRLSPAELTLDRVLDADPATAAFEERLDQTLKLVYPHLVTDQTGSIYLPAFHSVYRWSRTPQPLDGREALYRQVEGWWQFPGRIGSPKPVIVREPQTTPVER